MIESVSQVEITSRCSLRCHYCPQPFLKRPKADMSDDVFDRVCYWLGEFQQKLVHLHHFGESTMHPKFIAMVDRISDIVPEVAVSSNGVGVTREMIAALKGAGLSRIALSIHRPEVVSKVEDWCIDVGLAYEWASGPLSAKHNWAGQVEGRNSAWAETFECHFLRDQACVILQDGRVANCCIDAEGVSSEITVFDDLRSYELKPFALCGPCHHQVPAKYAAELELVAV